MIVSSFMIIFFVKQKEINIFLEQSLKKEMKVKVMMFVHINGQKKILDIVIQKDLMIFILIILN